MNFTVVLTEDPEEPGIFNATVPALPGCHTWGESKDEAYQNALEAIACCIESMRKENEPIPVEVEQKVVTV